MISHSTEKMMSVVCKQTIPLAYKADVIKERSDKLQEIEEAYGELEKKWDLANLRLNEIYDVSQNINVEQSAISDAQIRIQTENRSIEEWNTDIERANAVDTNAEENKKKLVDLRDEERQVSDTKNTLNDQRYYSEISANLLKDTGIKTKIINQYLPVINHYVNHYLQALDFFVQFNLDGSFKETIKSRYRDDFSYASFSEVRSCVLTYHYCLLTYYCKDEE